MLDLSLSIPAQSMSFVLIPSWHSLVIHNDIADTHKTNTYLNNILVICQDIYNCFWTLTKLSCSLESSFHTIRSFSTHIVFLFKAFQKKFMSSYPFGYCLAHIQALSPLPNFLPNLAPPPIFLSDCVAIIHHLDCFQNHFYSITQEKNHSSLGIIPKST